jgi:mitochondrial fission protein ELM1
LTELRRILVIDEGSPGHLVQSRGLARALAAHCRADLVEYRVRLTLRGFLRPLLRLAGLLARRGLPDGLLRLAYRLPAEPPPPAGVVVVSGGRGFHYAVSLARRTGARLVYCGDPAPLPARWCDVVLSPQVVPGHPRSIASGLLLTDIAPGEIADTGARLREAFAQGGGARLAALLIGGDSRSHRYTAADWTLLIEAVNRLGEQGWRWLLTTSRRTPPEVEARLRREIRAEWLVGAVWWHGAPERLLPAFLDAADLVLVTRDSLSMLSEAVAAGKPAIALRPQTVRPAPVIDAALRQAERERSVREVAFGDLVELLCGPEIAPEKFAFPAVDRRLALARATARLLALNPPLTGKMPVFGIVVPTYNRPAYLIEAIRSLHAQTYPHWKMLICDDASRVDYAPVLPWLADRRLRMMRVESNGGLNRARNLCIDRAWREGCDHIVFMDDEDRLEPRALEVAAAMLSAHPEAGWLISNTCGDIKPGQREVTAEGRVDWFADYVYGRRLRGDKTHVIALDRLAGIRFDDILRGETWHFFQPLAARTQPWAYPFPSRRSRYRGDGITRSNARHPQSWREIHSRYARHLQVIRLRPQCSAAYRYTLLELLKTPQRLLRLVLAATGRGPAGRTESPKGMS